MNYNPVAHLFDQYVIHRFKGCVEEHSFLQALTVTQQKLLDLTFNGLNMENHFADLQSFLNDSNCYSLLELRYAKERTQKRRFAH